MNEKIPPAVHNEGDLRGEELRVAEAYERRKTIFHTSRYTVFSPANLLALQELERGVIHLLKRQGLNSLQDISIFDVGCGAGGWLRRFVCWGAQPENLAGVDLLPDRVESAAKLCAPGTNVRCGNAAALDVPDASYDLVLQFTLFTSVLNDDVKRRIAAEMLRILKPTGTILWYDFFVNNPRNPDVRGVKRGEIRRLFPGCRIKLRRVTLAPPLARRLATYASPLCRLLSRIPLLCTHYLGTINKTSEYAKTRP
ncbi:MAG: class I SAM-dependent methyltransferase [Pirellulales bacterium]|nr:class I SAM-dependent methyltransferase [Pirellulales bacterium]